MVRILVPSGALGLAYDHAALARGIAAKPDLIAIDGGSTDSGPSYLGRGVSKYARTSTKADWAALMRARAEAGVPLVIGTAGTCGTDSTVDWMLEITKEIANEMGQSLKIAVLRSSQVPSEVAEAMEAGRVAPLEGAPAVTVDHVRACTNVVALAGAEQINAALETGADIVIAGRATDTGTIAALPLARGCHAGGAWHGAKIGECGALCTTRPQSGVILIDFDAEGFLVTPLADGARATPHTVSAHLLYENADPFILTEPGGYLDVSDAIYTAQGELSVRVTGARWVEAPAYTVKLEGARCAGFQTVAMAMLRDPRYVVAVEDWAQDIAKKCRAQAIQRLGDAARDAAIDLRLIGRNATLGALETKAATPTEVGVMGIVTAPTQALASEVGRLLNPFLLHHPLTADEELPTFAFPFSPAEIDRGPIYEFVLHHVMEIADPMEPFRLEVHNV